MTDYRVYLLTDDAPPEVGLYLISASDEREAEIRALTRAMGSTEKKKWRLSGVERMAS